MNSWIQRDIEISRNPFAICSNCPWDVHNKVYNKFWARGLTGDKSGGIKSRGFYPRIYPQLKLKVKNLMYLNCLTQENYPGQQKINYTVSEEQDRQVRRQTTAARLALCARPYFSVFFPPAFVESQMAQVDRLRILERGVLGSSSRCCGPFVVVFTFFSFQSEDSAKF